MTETIKGILLVGHGGLPADCPRELVARLMQLERARQHTGSAPSREEMEIDRQIRLWPRTRETDPYQAGLERVKEHLAPRIGEKLLKLAYNEFCAPSIEQAAEELIEAGAGHITVVSTMFTPGGSHSEREIPEIVETLKRRHPEVRFTYAWPYDLDRVADLLLGQIESAH
jgi:sirohydrochlorin cobaltochelatase